MNTLHEKRGGRIPGLDAARGLAVILMIGYHLLFDLRAFVGVEVLLGFDLLWKAGAWAITGTFLVCSGASIQVANSGWRRFSHRQVRIALGAVCVSLATYFFTPECWIHFGVLHCLFFAGFACQLARKSPKIAGGVGVVIAAAWAVGILPSVPAMAERDALDYVPLIPWVSMTLFGVCLGARLRGTSWAEVGKGKPALRWAGRHSLAIYLLHQPAIIGALVLAGRMSP